jgi:hypothetical protein
MLSWKTRLLCIPGIPDFIVSRIGKLIDDYSIPCKDLRLSMTFFHHLSLYIYIHIYIYIYYIYIYCHMSFIDIVHIFPSCPSRRCLLVGFDKTRLQQESLEAQFCRLPAKAQQAVQPIGKRYQKTMVKYPQIDGW